MNFEDLEIYKLSFNLSDDVYDLTLKFPNNELYGLTNQIRRASVSIFSNISEGFGKGTNKDFRRFLFNSKGSLNEVNAQISFANRRSYISIFELHKIRLQMDILDRKLTRFIKNMKI